MSWKKNLDILLIRYSVDQIFTLTCHWNTKNKPIELCCEYKLISESCCQKSFSSEPNNVVKYSLKTRFKNHQSPFKYQRIGSNLLVTLHISKTNKVILYHWVHLNSEKITWSRWWKTEWHQKLPLFSLTKSLQKRMCYNVLKKYNEPIIFNKACHKIVDIVFTRSDWKHCTDNPSQDCMTSEPSQ